MTRFVDLSQTYWTDPEENGGPICAFLNTTSDRFYENGVGQHTFMDMEDILTSPKGEYLAGLVPAGYFGDVEG